MGLLRDDSSRPAPRPAGRMPRLALLAAGLIGAAAAVDAVAGPAAGPADIVVLALALALGTAATRVILRALARSERREQRLRSLVQNSADVVTIVGPDLTIEWQAESVRDVLGHEPADLVDTPFLDLVADADAGPFLRLLEHTAPGASGLLAARVLDSAGELRDVEAVVVNRRHDPHVRGVVVSMRDATDRRRLERERDGLAAQRIRDAAARAEVERLRERVEAAREKQVLEQRLQRSQRLESVGQLAGGIAHDFNNLLAVIQNYAAFVREELPPELGLHSDLEEIERAAERGARLTRQLLLFGQRKLSAPEALDADEVIRGLDGLLQGSVGQHIDLRYAHAEGLAQVCVDPGSLEQVVVNLVINARDALGTTPGAITVATGETLVDDLRARDLGVESGVYVSVTVADTGEGMDAATVARAFEPFFTTKPTGQGTGLGLATVYGIVQGAGGCVAIESAPRRGTTVEVLLPATSDGTAREAEAPPAPVAAACEELIFVVDDEEPLRALVERILSRAGYAVVTASSAEEALTLYAAAETPPDLVLSDMVMPGRSGQELAAELRAERPDQRVLLMSGYSDELLRGGPLRDEVVAKPFSAEVLLRRVREALDAPENGPGARELARETAA